MGITGNVGLAVRSLVSVGSGSKGGTCDACESSGNWGFGGDCAATMSQTSVCKARHQRVSTRRRGGHKSRLGWSHFRSSPAKSSLSHSGLSALHVLCLNLATDQVALVSSFFQSRRFWLRFDLRAPQLPEEILELLGLSCFDDRLAGSRWEACIADFLAGRN